MSIAIYYRVATEGQGDSGTSIINKQLVACRDLAQELG